MPVDPRRTAARYEVSNINGSPRSQNVRYQCANVGFLALKLPSHSGIIQARIVCRRRIPSAVSLSLPSYVGFLIVDVPLRVASASPSIGPPSPLPRLSSVLSLQPVPNLGGVSTLSVALSRCH